MPGNWCRSTRHARFDAARRPSEEALSNDDLMSLVAEIMLPWRQGLQSLRRDWVPLIAYELGVSLFAATLVGPLALALSYQLIGLRGESAAGNWELLELLLSPFGALAFMCGASLMIGWAFIEYSGLIVLADAALRGSSLSTRQVLARILDAAPRLFGLAVLQTSLAIVMALPFLGLAAATYWLLLADADINYYLTERPPRFWIALTIGIVLAAGCFVCMVWFFVRWALAVPACVIDGQNWLAALRLSSRLMRGRAWRMLIIFVGWQSLKYIALVAAIAGLNQVNEAIFAVFAERLSLLVWSTLALLLLDAAGLQLLGAIFAIGLAIVLACEYEQAQRSGTASGGAVPRADWPRPRLGKRRAHERRSWPLPCLARR